MPEDERTVKCPECGVEVTIPQDEQTSTDESEKSEPEVEDY